MLACLAGLTYNWVSDDNSDDAVQSYTINAVNNILAQRKNPNGCSPKMTYYTQIDYTNFTLVTDWLVAGNEIADHT